MGYLQEVEHKLRQYLVSYPVPVQNDVIKYVKTRILESYKNGLAEVKMTKTYGPKRSYQSKRSK